MTTVTVPAELPAEPEPEVQSAAGQVLTDLRSAATDLGDVSDWTRSHGAPGGWEGQAADAADHAMTRFARSTDIVSAALQQATAALDVFLGEAATRRAEHLDLMERRTTLNQQRTALVERITGAPEDQAPALQGEADALAGRMAAWGADVRAWRERVQADEDRLIGRLRSVDTVAEGERAADRPGRPDPAALADQLQSRAGDPAAVADWWAGLSPAEREALVTGDPDLVGNTNGIPSGDRDEANRAALDRDREWLEGRRAEGEALSSEESRLLDNAVAAQAAIDKGSEPPYDHLDLDVNLLVYQPGAFDGDGAVAVSFGDPDTADHTAVIVPGFTNDMLDIPGQADSALALWAEASEGGDSVATIAWMGYDAPSWNPTDVFSYPGEAVNAAGVVTEAQAEAGGHLLSDFVDGLDATHHGEGHTTVIGHSYGSTTAAHSAADGLSADALVLVGSPGAGGGVDHVSDLGMPAGQVYVGSADHDFVTWLGGEGGIIKPGGIVPDSVAGLDDGLGLGNDPAQEDFGAVNIGVEDGEPFHVDEIGSTGIGNHSGYFDEGSESLDNIASVVTGDPVVDEPGRDQEAHDLAVDWLQDEAAHQAGQVYDHYVDPIVDTVTETFQDIWPDWP